MSNQENRPVKTRMLKAGRVGKAELSRRLDVSIKTIMLWLQDGTLPPQYRLGTISFWTEEQISDWLAEQNLPDGYIQPVSETATAETQQAS